VDVEGQSSCELLDNTLSFALWVPRPVASLLLLAKSPAKYAKPSSSLSRPRSSLQLRGVLWDLRHRLLRGNAMRREGAVPVDLASEVHGSRNRQEPGFGRNVLNGALPPQSNSLRCPMTPLPRFPVIRENSRAPQLRSRRLRIQHGSLALVSRKEGPAAWQFRWSEKDLHGARVQRKRVIGTVERYLDEARARSAIAVLLAEINSDKVRMGSRSINVAQLCDHFQQLELARDNTWRSYSTKETYQAYLTRWVLPHWRHFELAEVRTIQETREPLWNPCRKQSK